MKNRHRFYIAVVVVILCFGLIACSALRVDVDVYKGPLADEQDIQMERMAVMAIGAKPLITELRDQLENKERRNICEKYGAGIEKIYPGSFCGKSVTRIFGRHLKQYKDSYMETETGLDILGGQTLVGTQALRVNAVLSLYKDRKESVLASIFQKINSEKMAYDNAVAVLQKTHVAWNATVTNRLRSDGSNHEIRMALWRYFGNTPVEVSQKLFMFRMLKRFCQRYTKDMQLVSAGDRSEQEFLQLLGDHTSGVADAITRVYLADSEKDALHVNFDLISKSIAQRARAFLASRLALQKTLELTLQGYIAWNTEQAGNVYPDEQTRKFLLATIAALVSPGKFNATDVSYWGNSTNEVLDKFGMLGAARMLHEHKKMLEKYKDADKISNQYGLTKVFLFEDDTGHAAITSALSVVDFVLGTLKAVNPCMGFEKGRLDSGLETLTEDYIKAEDGFDEAVLSAARKRLRNALIRYAQKVLTIANNEVLLGQYSDAEDAGNRGAELPKGSNESAVPIKNKEIVQNTQILQAIGNSIMIQASELAREERYTLALRNTAMDVSSLKAAYEAMPGKQVLADLVGHLEKRLVSARGEANKQQEIIALQQAQNEAEQQAEQYALAIAATAKVDSPADITALIVGLEKLQNEAAEAIAKTAGNGEGQSPAGTLHENKEVLDAGVALAKLFRETHPAGGQGGSLKDFTKYLKDESNRQKKVAGEAKAELEKRAKGGKPDVDLAAQVTDLKAAVDLIRKQIETWKDDISAPLHPAVTYEMLMGKLEAENQSAAAAVRSSNYMPPEVLPGFMLDSKHYADSKAVLDQLITALAYRRIKAYETNSTQMIHNLTNAIRAARGLRSNKAFLRPASAYLRYSYPATSLQDEEAYGWQNMLTNNFRKSIPFLGEWRSNENKRRYAVLNELDKQSWQNINTIRLNGAGSTNYVLAKDPVGNWTVKAYSTNATAIANSARNLAMYSMGVPITSLPLSGTAGGQGQKATSAMDTLYERFRADYAAQTTQHLNDLRTMLDQEAVRQAVIATWSDSSLEGVDTTALHSTLADSLQQLTVAKDAPEEEQIVALLAGLRRFYVTLEQKIDAATLAPEGAAPQEGASGDAAVKAAEQQAGEQNAAYKAAAKARAVGWARTVLEQQIAKRKECLQRYFVTVSAIGEVVSSDEAESSNKTVPPVQSSVPNKLEPIKEFILTE